MSSSKIKVYNKKVDLKEIRKHDIVFQLNDWQSYDYSYIKTKSDSDSDSDNDSDNDSDSSNDSQSKFKRKITKLFKIVAYGKTEDGNSVSVTIDKFTPYFFIRHPEKWTSDDFIDFRNKLLNNDKFKNDFIKDVKPISIKRRIPFYNFTNKTESKYIRIIFKSIAGWYNCIRYIKNEPIRVRKKDYDLKDYLCETKVTPLLRFFHVKNVNPIGWIKLPRKKYKLNSLDKKNTNCDIDCNIHYNDIEVLNKTDIGPFKTLSYDIECTSIDGTFPNSSRAGDKVIQIGSTINIFGQEKIYKYIATLKKCEKIPGTVVQEFKNERELILGWCKFVKKVQPDIITGYNIWGFDWKYLYERANNGNGGISRPYFKSMVSILSIRKSNSKVYKPSVKYVEKELQSSALGQNFLRYIDIEGIVQIDLYKLIQKDYKLDSYKLDNVSKHFMKQQKEDLSPQQLFKNFNSGTPKEIREIATYCIQDCALCNKLINKLQVIPNNIGMGNVCCIPFSYLFLRGQGIKIFSLVAKKCREKGYIIKNLDNDKLDKSSYEGAIVFVPEPGIYFEPVAVMDYASLYPSSMIEMNISHDSIVGFEEYKINKNNKPIIIKSTINEKYNNLPDYNYSNIQYDVFKGVGDDKVKTDTKFAALLKKDGTKSVLPNILMDLLKARKDTRKKMKYKTGYSKDGSKTFTGMFSENESQYIFKTVEGEEHVVNKDLIDKIENTYNEFQKQF